MTLLRMDGTLAPLERAIAPPKDYLDTVECCIKVGKREFDIGLDIYGGYIRGFPATRDTPAEHGGYVIDRVMLRDRDVTSALPDELLEHLNQHVNQE